MSGGSDSSSVAEWKIEEKDDVKIVCYQEQLIKHLKLLHFNEDSVVFSTGSCQIQEKVHLYSNVTIL